MTYSTHNKGLGICDRCGAQYKLRQLKEQTIKLKPSGLLVCKSCLDVDHPQLQQGMYPVIEKQAIRNPRPDTGNEASRELTGTYDPTTHAVL